MILLSWVNWWKSSKLEGHGLTVSRLGPGYTLTMGLELPWTHMWWFMSPSTNYRHHLKVSVLPAGNQYGRNWELRTWERLGSISRHTRPHELCFFIDLWEAKMTVGPVEDTPWPQGNLHLAVYTFGSKSRDGTDCTALKLTWKETSQMPDV